MLVCNRTSVEKDHNYLGVVHKWRHGRWGRGGQGFRDDSSKAFVIKRVTMGEGGQKLSKITWRHMWTAPLYAIDICGLFICNFAYIHNRPYALLLDRILLQFLICLLYANSVDANHLREFISHEGNLNQLRFGNSEQK